MDEKRRINNPPSSSISVLVFLDDSIAVTAREK